jgi:hypothetical protein
MFCSKLGSAPGVHAVLLFVGDRISHRCRVHFSCAGYPTTAVADADFQLVQLDQLDQAMPTDALRRAGASEEIDLRSHPDGDGSACEQAP